MPAGKQWRHGNFPRARYSSSSCRRDEDKITESTQVKYRYKRQTYNYEYSKVDGCNPSVLVIILSVR